MYGSAVINPPKAAIKNDVIATRELTNVSFCDIFNKIENNTTTEITVNNENNCKKIVRKIANNKEVININIVTIT